jgi:hypothetical protein
LFFDPLKVDSCTVPELLWTKALVSAGVSQELVSFSRVGLGLFKNGSLSKRVTMMILIIGVLVIGVLVGAVLGLRFKVFALVPVIFIALAVVALHGVARGDDFWRLAVSMIAIATSLQVGYLGGSFVLGSARGVNHRTVSLPTSRGMSGSV